jgi:hypothetical protein
MNTTALHIMPKFVDKIAFLLRASLCTSGGVVRLEACGTVCPKHRRNWHMRSLGMPTGIS